MPQILITQPSKPGGPQLIFSASTHSEVESSKSDALYTFHTKSFSRSNSRFLKDSSDNTVLTITEQVGSTQSPGHGQEHFHIAVDGSGNELFSIRAETLEKEEMPQPVLTFSTSSGQGDKQLRFEVRDPEDHSQKGRKVFRADIHALRGGLIARLDEEKGGFMSRKYLLDVMDGEGWDAGVLCMFVAVMIEGAFVNIGVDVNQLPRRLKQRHLVGIGIAGGLGGGGMGC